jgi:hypothetical protein
MEIAHVPMAVDGARADQVFKKLQDRMFGYAVHPAGRIDRNALHQRRDHLNLFFELWTVHGVASS